MVIFTAPHFTHYAIVYKPAKTEGPDQPSQPEEPAKPDQPVQPAQPNQPVQPAAPVTPDPANPLKPTEPSKMDQLHPNDFYSTGSSRGRSQGYGRSRDPSVVKCPPRSKLTADCSARNKDASKESQSEHLPNTASLEASFAAEAVLLAALGGFLLAGKKKEE